MCLPRPIGEFSEIEPGSHQGVRVSQNILPKDPLHLSPIDGQVKEITGALAHLKASSGPVGTSMEAYHRDPELVVMSYERHDRPISVPLQG